MRAQERELRTWLQGMEGATGFGGVPAPEYGTASRDTAQALTGVEHTLREEAAEEVTKAAEWRNNVPVVGWPAVPAPVRQRPMP